MTIVEFFDKSPIENIASALLCGSTDESSPMHVIFVGESKKKMEKAIALYREVTERRNLCVKFTCKPVNRNSLASIVDVLAEIAEDYSLEYLTEDDRESLRDFVAQKKATGHACLMETAKAYYWEPETVRLDRIRDESGDNIHRFDEFSKLKIDSPFNWMANYPNSYSGANEYVLNERIAKAIAEYYPKKLAESIRFLKTETISDEFHKEWLAKQ